MLRMRGDSMQTLVVLALVAIAAVGTFLAIRIVVNRRGSVTTTRQTNIRARKVAGRDINEK